MAACANEYMPQEPENLIPEDKFIEMIVDIHIADAVLSNEQMHDVNLADTTKSYYNFVFNKHQVSRYDFNEQLKQPKKQKRKNNGISGIGCIYV